MSIKFQPPLLATFATVLLVSIFITLGNWQLNRADEKDAMQDKYAAEQQQDAVALITQFEDIEQWRYRNVYIDGTPLSQRQFLLDNQVRDTRAGYNVLTPFKLNDNRIVLVDRGWIPIGADRSDIPDIRIDEKPMRIQGYLYTPYGEAFTLGDADDSQTGWPHIINHLDFAAIGKLLHTTLEPLTIRMHSNQPSGFRRDWPLPTTASSDKHLAYAVQWFALAFAVLIIFLALNIKIRK